jgi:ACS family tartrate transporter-like MFS transporter
MAVQAQALEQITMRKVYWRLLPLAILAYFLAYLDRINVSFAALTMNKDLGLDAAIYGMAAGAFFWGYFLFEVPSNLILEKVGARIWIARIMVSWGLISGATAFCTGPWSFLTMRFLLGLAEAGLFPGMILFFTYWFPDWHRARIVSGFMIALPVAVAAGAPVSTGILEGFNGVLGLAGWKWMFIGEAIPTVLIGIVILFCVTDRPHLAHWLSDDQRSWLITTLETERNLVEAKRKISVWQSFFDPRFSS